VTKNTQTIFRCDVCGAVQHGYDYSEAPHGWRKLSWGGGFEGDEGVEAHFCGNCHPRYFKALEVLLNHKGTQCT